MRPVLSRSFLGDAFGGFQDDVKIILLQQLGAAGPQDVRSGRRVFRDRRGAGWRSWRCASVRVWAGGAGLDGAAVGQLVSGEGENPVKVLALGIEPAWGIRCGGRGPWIPG